jgi:hypothetical protein
MARAVVRSIDKGLLAEIQHARALNGRGVKVGIQAGAGAQDGVDILDIVIWNEFGTRRIPSRPVMRSYFDENQAAIAAEAERAGTFMLRTGAIQLGLDRLGMSMQKDLQAHWRKSKSWAVPNSAYTIKMKGSDVPLIDHGVAINAVRWVTT